MLRLVVGGISRNFTLKEVMEKSYCLAMMDEVKKKVKQQFGLSEEQIENARDVYWHNAYKIKVHKAIPEAGYTARTEFEDHGFKNGRNFYYLRVSQLNGQYAWSSPIWVENGSQ